MATIQELRNLACQIRDAEQNGENTALRVGQFLVELVNHFNTKADVDNISGAFHLKQQQAPIMALMSVQQMTDSNGQDNKAWWSTDGHIKYQHNGRIYDLGTPAYMLYYCGDKIYKWTGSATGFKLMTDGGGGSSGGGASRVLEQRVAIIAEILQNAVFTSDQSQRFEDLATLEDAVDSITLNVSSHTFNGIGGTFTLVATTVPGGKSVRWESSRPAVASVDSNGVVTPVGYGTCVITAKAGSNNVAATCSITVQQFQVDSVSIDQSDILLENVTEGFTKQLTATTMYNGQVVQAGVTWSSSNPGVATIDANTGLVTVIGNGQTTITAISGTESDTITIRVSGVVKTFHVRLGTLSNVTIEDGQGNAITNGQAVLEGSSLTVKLVPAASHQITTASVTMGGVAQTLTDNQDGSKSVTLNVNGDIEISASATYVEKDLIDDATKVTGYGVVANTSGQYKAESNYDCFIVPLEFGKRYKVSGYVWQDNQGTRTGFNLALVKDDGNGGYTNLLESDLSGSLFTNNNELFTISTRIYKQTDTGFATEFSFAVPTSDGAPGINAVYLAINTRFSAVDISSYISITEIRVKDEYDADTEIKGLGFLWTDNYTLQSSSAQSIVIVRAEKGATYSYSGFDYSGSDGRGFSIGLCHLDVGLVSNILASDFKSGSTWLSDDSYFDHTTNIVKHAPSSSGQFTVPSASDIDGDVAIVLGTRLSGTDVAEDITLTKIY